MLTTKLVGERIAYFLKEKGISQQKLIQLLAEKSGQSFVQGTISNWKNGVTSAPIELAPVFCEIFEVSYEEFFGIHATLPVRQTAVGAPGGEDETEAFKHLKRQHDVLVHELKKCEQEKQALETRFKNMVKAMKKYL